MIINPANIEKWCFDYFEGNLTTLEKQEFERFILEHPEFHAEFEAWKEANESEDEKVPVFGAVDGLLVAAPFYATLAFRLSLGVVLVALLGYIGFVGLDNVDKEYTAQSNSLNMSWNPDHHMLSLVRYSDYAYGDYDVKTNTTVTHHTNTIYINNGAEGNSETGNEAGTLTAEESWEFNNGNEHVTQGTKVPVDFVTFYNAKTVNETTFASQSEELMQEYKEDSKSLYDHLGIKAGRYQFLNFNNSRVKGLGNNHSAGKNKNGKNNNHATITQSKMKSNKGGSHKKKKGLFSNLKHIELGLTNINDPISLAPNGNIIGVNPALAGQLGVTRLKLNVRNQWWNTDESLFRGSMYFDTYFEKIQAGVAYGTEYDFTENGQQKISKHSFTYAQKFSLSKKSNISVGLTYEMFKGENLSTTHEMNEFYANSPIVANSLDNEWKSDLGLSTWYSGKYFFGGINVTNLLGNTFIATHEENTSYINNVNFSVQLGTDYKRSIFANTVVSPMIQYNKVGNHNDLWLGSVVRIKGLVLGGSVATSKSAKATLGLQGNKFRFTVSSDYSKSLLLDEYAFSHEVSVRVLLGNKNNNWSRYDY
jgi:hypothetical protein